ncbi:MAG: helix-turn-helix transcriptional regulator [Lachnospiraceae bacterium]|nr:helix-turn-helix transcriptional regulator [Lachnospiraceae bacterium]
MSTTKDIGSNIREQRMKRGLTQRQLAEQLFVSASAVSKWEMKAAIPDIHMVIQLADIFQISVSELLGAEDKASEECADKMLEEYPDKTSEEETLAVAEANVIEPITPEKGLCKYLKILIPVAIIAVLGCIAFSLPL